MESTVKIALQWIGWSQKRLRTVNLILRTLLFSSRKGAQRLHWIRYGWHRVKCGKLCVMSWLENAKGGHHPKIWPGKSDVYFSFGIYIFHMNSFYMKICFVCSLHIFFIWKQWRYTKLQMYKFHMKRFHMKSNFKCLPQCFIWKNTGRLLFIWN